MAEHHVSIGGQTFDVPDALPGPGHPEPDRERGRLPPARGPARPLPDEDRHRLPDARPRRSRSSTAWACTRRTPTQVLGLPDLLALQELADEVYVDHGVVEYAVSLVLATRHPGQFSLPELEELLAFGASPRASLGLVAGARCARPAAGPQLRPAPGRLRRRPRRAAPPAGAELRGAGPGAHRRAPPDPPAQHRARPPGRRPSQDPAAAPAPPRPAPPARAAPRPARPRHRRAAPDRPRPPAARRFGRAEPMTVGQRGAAPHLAGQPAAEHRHRPVLRGAAPPRADRHPPPRRAAAGRLPGAGARPRHRGRARPGPTPPGDDVRRIDWNVTARTLEPHIRQTIADRELETWVVADFSASLAFGTADCEKRDLALAAMAAVGLPHPAHRQPHRRGRARGRPHRHPAGPHRAGPPPGAAAPGAAGGQGRPPRRLRPRRRAAAPGHRHPAPRPGRRRLRLPRRRRLGPARCGPSAPATRCWPSRSSIPASSSCPTSACSTWSTPRPASVREVNTGNARTRARFAEAAAAQRADIARAHPRAPAPTTWCSAPTPTGCSTWCASSPGVASGSRPVTRLPS